MGATSRGRRQAVVRTAARRVLVALAVVVCVLGVEASPVQAGVAQAGSEGWSWPLAGVPPVVHPFQPPANRYGPGHRGVDLAAPAGAEVRAAGAGRVSYAGMLAGRSVVVVVHGDLRTTYEPVTASVRLGQSVTAGEPIGNLEAGHEGCAAAACLHWGLRRGEQYLDPLALVGAGPVRLLPLSGGTGVTAGGPAAVAAAGVGRGAGGPSDAEPEPAREPPLDLRAAFSPSGALALLALLAGLALLVRRPPNRPAGGAAAAQQAQQIEAPDLWPRAIEDGPEAAVLDLACLRGQRASGAS